MCAVGCLITDEAYRPALEGQRVTQLAVLKALEKSGITMDVSTGIMLLVDLQEMHDCRHARSWPRIIGEIEQKYFGGEM